MRRPLCPTLLCVAGGLLAQAVRAEDIEDDRLALEVDQQAAAIATTLFDGWMFERQTQTDARRKFERQLQIRIRQANQVCRLSPAQTRKLELAGRAEIKRLFESVDSARRDFVSRKLANLGDEDGFFRKHDALRQSVRNSRRAFREESLFHKVAHSVLADEQLTLYLERDRRAYRQVLQASLLSSLDRQLSLDDRQRRKLAAVLDELPLTIADTYERSALWYFAAQVPAERYRAFLNDDQWKLLEPKLASARDMRSMLIEVGAIAEDAAEGGP